MSVFYPQSLHSGGCSHFLPHGFVYLTVCLVSYFCPDSELVDSSRCGCLHSVLQYDQYFVFVAVNSGLVEETRGSCPGCGKSFEVCDSARRSGGVDLTRRAGVGRYPGALAGFPAIPRALKRRD